MGAEVRVGNVVRMDEFGAALTGLLQSLFSEISMEYLGRTTMAVRIINYPDADAVFDALAAGDIHMTHPYFAISGAYRNRARTAVFSAGCSAVCPLLQASTLAARNITSPEDLAGMHAKVNSPMSFLFIAFQVGVLGTGNVALVQALWPFDVLSFSDTSQMVGALTSNAIDAIVSGSIPTNVSSPLRSFSMRVGNPAGPFFRQDSGPAKCEYDVPRAAATGNDELAQAVNAAFMEVFASGDFAIINEQVAQMFPAALFPDAYEITGDCAPQTSLFPYPEAPTQGEVLARVLRTNRLLVCSSGTQLAADATQVQSSLLSQAIAKRLGTHYGTTLLAMPVGVVPAEMLQALEQGLCDMTSSYLGVGGFLESKRRNVLFQPSCGGNIALCA